MNDEIWKRALWFGPKNGIDEGVFRRRDIDLNFVDENNILAELPLATGVVFNYGKRTFNIHLARFVVEALNNGCLVVVSVPNDSAHATTKEHLSKLNPSIINNHNFELEINQPDYVIAQMIARRSAKREPSLKLYIDDSEAEVALTLVEKQLLRRAFWDCKSIKIHNLAGGRSEARLFKVDAQFSRDVNPQVELEPLPYFLKIDDVEKKKTEIENYEKFGNGFLPFNLRPHLDLKRCVEGCELGLIVGDFVEGADLLLDLIHKGRADIEIRYLFDVTLRCWRQNATKTKGKPGKFNPKKISTNTSRTELLRRFGALATPEELNILINSIKDFDYKNAICHGDLHGKNIMTRENEAVLIDFAQVDFGPINADCAALEVSIAIEKMELSGKKKIKRREWKKFVYKIYNPEFLLTKPPNTIGLGSEEERLWKSIRKIRQTALTETISENEYSFIIAMRLLNIAGFDPSSNQDNYRKAHAFILAESILVALAART